MKMTRVPELFVAAGMPVQPGRSAFRTDINGLRAWAVVSVVLFHFLVPGFAGGFIGVDVFFVISGFLMTRIITEGLEGTAVGKDFSVIRFLLARAIRILPALLVLCASLLALGRFLLPETEFHRLGRHVVASIGFVSNMAYWREAGYFDVSSRDKWLLHTWSLSVEWQFYILFPIVLRLFWRIRSSRDSLSWFMILGAFASLGIAIFYTPSKPTSAFFLLPSRCWEMLAGGIVLLTAGRTNLTSRTRRYLEWTGFILVTASVLLFSEKTSWPGWRAIIPVLGASSILIAARVSSPLTGSRVIQWLGSRSYSLYLWHWPIVVGIAYFDVQSEWPFVISGLVLTVVLGDLSYRWVENTSRSQLAQASPRRVWTALASAASIVVVPALWSAMTPETMNTRNRGDDLPPAIVMASTENGWCFRDVDNYANLPMDDRHSPCVLGQPGIPVTGLLIGDSYAGQYEPFWDEIGKDALLGIDSVTTNWCFPSTSLVFPAGKQTRYHEQCMIDRRFMELQAARYDLVILAGFWRYVLSNDTQDGLYRAMDKVASKTKLVIVMPAPTEFDVDVGAQYERKHVLGSNFDIHRFKKSIDGETRASNAVIEAYTKHFDNVVFLRRDDLFNVAGEPSDVTPENIPFSLDGRHISVYGSRKAAQAFLRSTAYARIRPMLAKSTHPEYKVDSE